MSGRFKVVGFPQEPEHQNDPLSQENNQACKHSSQHNPPLKTKPNNSF